jgi:hypothetical protein
MQATPKALRGMPEFHRLLTLVSPPQAQPGRSTTKMAVCYKAKGNMVSG